VIDETEKKNAKMNLEKIEKKDSFVSIPRE